MNTLKQTKLEKQVVVEGRLMVSDFAGEDFRRFVNNWIYGDGAQNLPNANISNLPKLVDHAVFELRQAMSSCA
jgi:hypothetical protein